MVNAQQLGERITRMFNFIYEVNGGWYVLGRDYFKPCDENQHGAYMLLCKAIESKNTEEIISHYKRVRRYTSDAQPGDRERDMQIIQFVNSLNEIDLESLYMQVNRAEEYAIWAVSQQGQFRR